MTFPDIFFSKRQTETDKVVNLNYYGGAKGNVLHLVHNDDGTITSSILKEDDLKKINSHNKFESNLRNIQEAASKLVAIQESAKRRGTFTDVDNKIYADNLLQLGVAAQELAKLQETGHTDDFRKLFEAPYAGQPSAETTDQKLDNNKYPEEVIGEEGYPVANDDSVQINAPSKEAAVAESKPIGLSIAGEGGVASAKPIATSIAGPEGLAVSRPVGTAIAGVSPSEVSSLGIPLPNRFRTATGFERIAGNVVKSRYRLTNDGRLVGPVKSINSNQAIIVEAPESTRIDFGGDSALKQFPIPPIPSNEFNTFGGGNRRKQPGFGLGGGGLGGGLGGGFGGGLGGGGGLGNGFGGGFGNGFGGGLLGGPFDDLDFELAFVKKDPNAKPRPQNQRARYVFV